ncbi:MAG TPA: peptidylprolyl isomerase [Pontiella sp.]
MFDNFINKKLIMTLPAVALLILTGCEEEAVQAPPSPSVDLAQTKDLFTEPILANPLASDPTTVVVRVNGEDIIRGEIIERVQAAMAQFSGRMQPEEIEQARGQLYERFKQEIITQKLLNAAVAAAEIVVDEEEVNEAIEEVKARMVQSGVDFETFLSEQGTTLEEVKEEFRKGQATSQLLESQTEELKEITDTDAQEFYDANPDSFKQPGSVTASHILIKTDANDSDETKAEQLAKLEKIREDIIAGTITFEDAAKENSGCPSSAQGGALGTFGKGQMVPEFEVAAFTQEIEEVGEVVETQFGYHIIKVSERSEEGTVSFEDAKEKIVQFLDRQQKQKAVSDYLQSLRDSATIEEIAM